MPLLTSNIALAKASMTVSQKLPKSDEKICELNISDVEDEVDPKAVCLEDQLPSITIRSVLVGIIISAFGATCAQIFMFKPIMLHVHSLFIQLACLTTGKIVARLPGPKRWNPGPFGIKETTFSSIMACSASAGATCVEVG